MPEQLNELERITELEAEVARLRGFVADWVAELAQRDNGAVFDRLTAPSGKAPVTYGDLRLLMDEIDASRRTAERKEPTDASDG